MNDYSLNTLLETLESCDGDYVSTARGIRLGMEDFEGFTFWETDIYTRNCIVRTEEYELILICWNKGQVTPIHCHGGEECWVYMIGGDILETRYVDDGNGHPVKSHEMVLKAGRVTYMNDDMGYHSLRNLADGRSMSLHLYANPIDDCRVYNESESRFERKSLTYYSLGGKVLEHAGQGS